MSAGTDAVACLRLLLREMLGRRGPFGQHQPRCDTREIARPDSAQVRPELGGHQDVRLLAAEIGDQARQSRQHAAETLATGEEHRPRENADTARVGPRDRQAAP